jgi:D-3-phosphoglycerate dehydrogenase
MKVLIATEKPFAPVAVQGMQKILSDAGAEVLLLEKYLSQGDLLQAVSDVDALIVRSDKVMASVIDAAKSLKIVVRAGAGYDNINLAACTARGIVAMNTPGQNSNAVAELAIGLMIYAARNMFTSGTGSELQGKTLGIHAYGNVGRRVALLGKGLGMTVRAFDPFVTPDAMQADGVEPCAATEELYGNCQYVSVHIPSTDKTRASINAALVGRMPKGATLVNTARKEIIDEAGLLQLLTQRVDLHYVTDVAPSLHAEMQAALGTRYFATPKKMGAETAEANVNAGLAAATQIVKFFATGDTTFQVKK